ncbi:hypothetical protein ANN_12824 [Periplaneta americana]|uniref:Uncharacterized protein n=1 Tax=Periplaneta americana TaxID=6978 RepID=A0ABQ8TK72_PERAM|nr:hypothetical protein ANN_12824 [Periplaneta americana]
MGVFIIDKHRLGVDVLIHADDDVPVCSYHLLSVQFKVCHGSLYAVMWLADEPREFNFPTLPQRCISYEAENLPSKYGVHSEEYLKSRDLSSSYLKNVNEALRDETRKKSATNTASNSGMVVLYGCETWTLTLRVEQRLRVFENEVLRKIFGAKRDEVTGEWRTLRNAELHALYSSPDIIRNIKSRHLRCWEDGGIKNFGEDNIKMDLREVRCHSRDWINLSQDRNRWRAYVRAAINLWVI